MSDEQKEFLLALALWKIELPAIDITSAIERAGINGPPVTQVYWPADELFRAGADEREEDADADDEQDAED